MKLLSCPCCGWPTSVITVNTYARSHQLPKYHIFCSHCGYSARESRSVRRAQWLWNHNKDRKRSAVIDGKKRARFHIFGKEW